MKKILKSAITVSLVVVMLIGVTTAYFSDTETSEGNTFTTGSIDLKVDSTCLYNGAESGECGTWSETDLTGEKFFNFDDLKPGDYGVNTISLHVYDNDAYACTIIDNMVDTDDSVTEPELEFDNAMVGAGYGELSQEIRFFAWADVDGNNVWDAGEQHLFSNVEGPASDVLDGVVYDLHTPAIGTVMPGDTTQYLGVYWCYGNLTVNMDTNSLTCDGSGVTNLTQTDSLSADITFYVEQARNNPDFVCPELVKKEFVVTQESGQNEANRALGRPNIEYAVDGLCVDFTFNNPTNFFFQFDYRVDGESGVDGPWADILIGEGELIGEYIGETYNAVPVSPNQSQNVRVCGEDAVWAGLREGAEQNWYLDWIKFEAEVINT